MVGMNILQAKRMFKNKNQCKSKRKAKKSTWVTRGKQFVALNGINIIKKEDDFDLFSGEKENLLLLEQNLTNFFIKDSKN